MEYGSSVFESKALQYIYFRMKGLFAFIMMLLLVAFTLAAPSADPQYGYGGYPYGGGGFGGYPGFGGGFGGAQSSASAQASSFGR